MISTEISGNATTPSDNFVASHIAPGASETSISPSRTANPKTPRDLYDHPPNPFLKTAPVTLHSFPDYKPTNSIAYPGNYLLLPLRRDLLHRAIVFEGDNTRQGTASTKWRSEVHGSNRKIRPQKGTGRARLGDKKSPMLRGGGVAFGPKPRDFSTDLPAKIYDVAWRTALSYRYRCGDLMVLEGEAEIEKTGPGSTRWVREMLAWNQWGKSNGGSLILTRFKRENLWAAMGRDDKVLEQSIEKHGRCLSVDEVDVKDLLKGGRVIVERAALDWMFKHHTRDLKTKVRLAPGIAALPGM